VRLKAFAVRQGRDERAKFLQAGFSNFLRRDILLERQGIDSAELARVSVCRESVICARSVISAAVPQFEFVRCGNYSAAYLSGE
jgi:hypothetical protein